MNEERCGVFPRLAETLSFFLQLPLQLQGYYKFTTLQSKVRLIFDFLFSCSDCVLTPIFSLLAFPGLDRRSNLLPVCSISDSLVFISVLARSLFLCWRVHPSLRTFFHASCSSWDHGFIFHEGRSILT